MFLAVDDAFKAPVRQIVYGRGPCNIIVESEIIAAKLVVAAEDIQTLPKDAGFAVGDVLIGRKIRIERKLFHLL